MRIIIDADPIVYRAGFAGEKNHYVIVAEDAEGNLFDGSFAPTPETKGKKRATAWANAQAWAEKKELTIIDKEITIVPEELDHQLQIVRTQIEGIIAPIQKKLKELGHDEAREISLLLSGPDNFREKLATLLPYKGNRDAKHKPFHYQAIRDYLTQHWNARVIHGREADDEASIMGWESIREGKEDDFVIATIDKDLDQIPGWHYDYMKHVFTQIDEEAAELWFWQQVLSGDRTDNIGGACKIGPKKADAAVQLWYGLAIKEGRDWRKVMWDNAVELYKIQGDKGYECYYTLKQAEAAALETARLVYMQRFPRELWVPPGCEPKWLEGTSLDD